MSILRAIRLQLKSGYLKQAPEAYTFLRQYPPLSRDTSLPVRKVDARNIPYLDFYEKVRERNPLYSDEKVYPAYWAHEPQAMTLAKKWYEFQQSGMEETEAYEAAVSYVAKLEDESYKKLQEIVAEVQSRTAGDGAYDAAEVKYEPIRFLWDKKLDHDDLLYHGKASTISKLKEKIDHSGLSTNTTGVESLEGAELDAFIQGHLLQWEQIEVDRRARDEERRVQDLESYKAAKIEEFKLKIHESGNSIENLALADQGELDYFIQTFILHWNEVERERRMRDPEFVKVFDQLRLQLLGMGSREQQKIKETEKITERAMDFFMLNGNSLRTEKPFFYEDYSHYFARLKEQPYLGHWSEEDRIELSHWIIDTLAYKHGLKKASAQNIQAYLDQLRAHFFPMVRYPKRAEEFELPDETNFKRLMYNNGVGYHKRGVEVKSTRQVTSGNAGDGGKTEEYTRLDHVGKLTVKRFYRIPQILFPKETLTTTLTADHQRLKEILAEPEGLMNEISRAGHSEKSFPELEQELKDFVASTQPDTLSSLSEGFGGGDALSSLDALLADDEDDAHIPSSSSANSDMTSVTDEDVDDEDENEGEGEGGDSEGRIVAQEEREMDQNSPEWKALISKYIGLLDTDLEKERDSNLSRGEYDDWRSAKTEMDLKIFKRTRMDSRMLTRSRLGRKFDMKEGARRAREWKGRGMVLGELPNAGLAVMDNRE